MSLASSARPEFATPSPSPSPPASPVPAAPPDLPFLATSTRARTATKKPPPQLSKGPTSRRCKLLLLGTGGSAAVPDITCVTDPQNGCKCCLDTLDNPRSKNIRGNTGAVVRVPGLREGDEEKTILIDCGKTFREQALKFFPKNGLRKIDACVLTHHHADAIDGLDDLRAWTYKSAIESTIPVYCTRRTYYEIRASFGYMVSKAAASGSGALPSFEWHVMPDDQDWEICGVTFTPVPVHHGRWFTTPPRPLIALGFLIDSSVLYMSDVSYIPEEQWTRLSSYLSLPTQNGLFPSSPRQLPRLQALIIDSGAALRLGPSHFALPQAIATSRRLGALKTYLTDLGHGTTHDLWCAFGREFGRGQTSRKSWHARANGAQATPAWRVRDEREQQPPAAEVYAGLESHARVEDGELWIERALEAVEQWAGGVLPGRWVRPAVDGMVIEWESPPEGRLEEVEALRGEAGREGERGSWGETRVWDDEYAYE
ncbi:MBL fold metallo-hydrolase [Rhodotorula paludigena]|uniref:MBL fold metallo-hydrolase n=1 Tax=Rhodotorula paludigena TaxID=86838 RepID=UPI0031795FE1